MDKELWKIRRERSSAKRLVAQDQPINKVVKVLSATSAFNLDRIRGKICGLEYG